MKPLKIVTGVVLLVLVFMLFGSMQTVGVGQVGILTRYGRVLGEEQSGFHFVPPWENLTTMNVQTQKEQSQESASTKDLQNVTTDVAVNYQLDPSKVMDVYRNIGSDYVNKVVNPQVAAVTKSVTSQYNASDLVDQRPAVEKQLTKELTAALAARNIVVQNVAITNFAFSSQYSAAIENKQVAQQNVQTQQYNLQASQLQAQAQEKQKSSLSSQYLELQAIQKWNGKLPDTLAGGGTVFNIPLQGN